MPDSANKTYLSLLPEKNKGRYGQNFLKNPSLCETLLRKTEITSDSFVLEVGAGAGAMTQALLDHHCHVLSVEIDKSLEPALSLRFKKEIEEGRCFFIFDDVLNLNLREELAKHFGDKIFQKALEEKNCHLLGNLPYYITKKLLPFFFLQLYDFSSMSFMLQKEAAQRLLAKAPNHPDYQSKLYGIQAILLAVYGEGKILQAVPKTEFLPVPRVDSVFLTLESNTSFLENLNLNPVFWSEHGEDFIAFISLLFQARRKSIKNNLMKDFEKKQKIRDNERIPLINLFQDLNLSGLERAEALSPDVLVRLFLKFKSNTLENESVGF